MSVSYTLFDENDKAFFETSTCCFVDIPRKYKKVSKIRVFAGNRFTLNTKRMFVERAKNWGFDIEFLEKENCVQVKRKENFKNFLANLYIIRYLLELGSITHEWLRLIDRYPNICDFKLFQLAHISKKHNGYDQQEYALRKPFGFYNSGTMTTSSFINKSELKRRLSSKLTRVSSLLKGESRISTKLIKDDEILDTIKRFTKAKK